MNTLQLLITYLFDLYIMVVLMRIWLQLARADFYNPLSQFVVKVTSPIVTPLRRVIPSFGRIDSACLLLAFALIVLKLITLQTIQGSIAVANIVPILVWSVLGLVKQIGHLIFWVLILRAILSWVSQGRSPIEYVMAQLSEPLMAPIKKVIPSIGGLDLSIMILIMTMSLANSFMYEWLGLIWASL